VRNHLFADLWTGPERLSDAALIGRTTEQFCVFQVVQLPEDRRRFVYEPYSQRYVWIESVAIGPVGPPESVPTKAPPALTCAKVLYTG
jgi:hypothetical protein